MYGPNGGYSEPGMACGGIGGKGGAIGYIIPGGGVGGGGGGCIIPSGDSLAMMFGKAGGGGGGGMIVGGGGCDTDVRGNEKGAVKLGAEARCDDADGKRCGGIDACGCREVDCAGTPATASSLAVSITAEAFFLAPCFGGLSFPSSACRTVSKDSGVTLRVATAS